MNLVDEDLQLRALEPSDAQMLYALINDRDVERAVVGWSGPVSLHAQQDWIAHIQPDDFRFAIDSDGTTCGTATINPIDFKNRTANLNIKLLETHRGRGIGRRSVLLLLEYLFLELNMELVTAGVLGSNRASLSLFERIGFTRDGLLRSRVFKNGERHGIVIYSMLRTEFRR